MTTFARRADPHNSLASLHRTPWRFACNQQVRSFYYTKYPTCIVTLTHRHEEPLRCLCDIPIDAFYTFDQIWRTSHQTSLVNGVPGSGAGCGVGIDHAAVARARPTPYHTNLVSAAVGAENATSGTVTTQQTHPLWRAFSSVPGACALSPANAIATAFRRLEGPAVSVEACFNLKNTGMYFA